MGQGGEQREHETERRTMQGLEHESAAVVNADRTAYRSGRTERLGLVQGETLSFVSDEGEGKTNPQPIRVFLFSTSSYIFVSLTEVASSIRLMWSFSAIAPCIAPA